MTTQKYNYILQEATLEDVSDIASIQLNAFAKDNEFLRTFPPDTCSRSDLHAWQVAQHQTTLRYPNSSQSWKKIVKAVDPIDGKIVGWAEWSLCTAQDFHSDREENWPKGAHIEACKRFFGIMEKLHKENMGHQQHFYTHLLAVHPDYLRRGIAGSLVRWGTDQADALNLPCYIEATESSVNIYKKHGYQQVGNAATPLTDTFTSDVPVLRRPAMNEA